MSRRTRRRLARGGVPEARARTQASIVPPLLVLAGGLLAYLDGFQGAFVFDDRRAIVDNASIRRLSWAAFWPEPHSAVTGRPIVNLSLAINYAMGGLHVGPYHGFNVAVHLVTALVLLGVVRRTLLLPGLRERYAGGATWIATSAALIWVVHPLLSEGVTYVIQRTETLMGLFYLLVFYCVIRGVESASPRAWYGAAVGAFALGMGCKEVIATAPVVLLAYDRLFLSSSFRAALRQRRALYAGLAGVLVVLAPIAGVRVGHGFRVTQVPPAGARPWHFVLTQAGMILHYLQLSLWPHPLASDYDHWPVARSLADVLPSALVVGALLALTLWGFHRRFRLAFLGIWFFAILAPTSSVWPLWGELGAERRMYLPLAAVVMLLVLGGYALLREAVPDPRRSIVAALLVAAITATFVALTARRNLDYRTPTTFWTAAVAVRPTAVRARVNLGNVLYRSGRRAEATAQYVEAVRLDPGDALAQYGLGVALAAEGRTEEAIGHYVEALRINPDYAEAHNNLGILLQGRGRLDEAVTHYAAAIRIRPEYALAHYNLGIALQQLGQSRDALEHFEAAVKLDPGLRQPRAQGDRLRRGLPASE